MRGWPFADLQRTTRANLDDGLLAAIADWLTRNHATCGVTGARLSAQFKRTDGVPKGTFPTYRNRAGGGIVEEDRWRPQLDSQGRCQSTGRCLWRRREDRTLSQGSHLSAVGAHSKLRCLCVAPVCSVREVAGAPAAAAHAVSLGRFPAVRFGPEVHRTVEMRRGSRDLTWRVPGG